MPLIATSPSGSSTATWSISRAASAPTTISSAPAACFELRGDPDRFARNEPLPRVSRGRDDLAGLDPDPDLEPHRVLLQELLVERRDPDADVERGAGGAQRVVLVRDGDAERGHDRVARVLLHRAAVSDDRRRNRLEVAPQDGAERLRIERLGERHRLDDVDEEDRDEPTELHRRPRERSLFEKQRLVLPQDRGLELAQLRAGVDAELLDERLAGGAVGGERVRLPAGAVEREHELSARALAERLRLDERLELGDELCMPAEREIRLDPLLDGDRAQLLEPRDLGLRERLVQEVRERRAAPEGERLAQRTLGRCRISPSERPAPLLGETREAVEIDPLRSELELVARRARRDHGAERLTELGDVDLDGVRRRVGLLARPERLDQPIDGDDPAGLEREHGEQRARLRSSESDWRAIALHLDGAEEAYFELWGACPARSVHSSSPRSRVLSHFLTAPRGLPYPALSRS